MNINETFRIIHQNKNYLWKSGQAICIRDQFILELKQGSMMIRDLTRISTEKTKIKLERLPVGNEIVQIKLENDYSFKIMKMIHPEPACNDIAIKLAPFVTIPERAVNQEDRVFLNRIKQVTAASTLACLLFIFLGFTENETTPDEQLIPKKFAKLILKKPTEPNPQSSQGGASIAKAFQAKSVQRNLKSVLQGGLSKYSIMTTGRSIQSLSMKMSTQGNNSLASLEGKANQMIGSLHAGGYGTGQGISIKGQGQGQLEIGLNYKDAIVDEGLTKDEVAKVIHSHMNEIRYCYESAIQNDPSIAGKVLVDFKIGSRGSVAVAQTAENTMNNVQVGTCLIGKLKNWKFPEPRGGVQVAVTYPFLFKSLNR